jgi:hypothetical protein
MVLMICIPLFLPAYEEEPFAKGEDKQAINRELLLKDWITPDLRHEEIIQLYTSASKKEPDTGQHDHAAFVAKAMILSPRDIFLLALSSLIRRQSCS